ncbi:hypothetical protein [Cryobacterium sp. CG_9.6]|uniref:hypothetical protein n=1 Tax=Cryobacterium sp. CG_9.6 TaxID=2760710 RepID=UPI002475DDD1|nr:hypothetical protein [Cryobacterium sp. CG_9.6]MDH6237361.1 hypothetical protein [Cryobacterium sp. CG_9.6]
MTDLPTAKPPRTSTSALAAESGLRNEAETKVLNLGQSGSVTQGTDVPQAPSTPQPAASVPGVKAPANVALVVLVGMVSLAVAFIVMIIVSVTSESINALAVIATPIASMVAAYYGITLSIQQVKNEREEKEKALARADAADAARREIEVWSAQMESGLRVAMAKLTAARIGTDEVTKAAGTPDDFF